MRTTYRVLAYLIAFEVMIQAAAIAFATFGLNTWIEEGGVLDSAALESAGYDGVIGTTVHIFNGYTVIPALALILLIVSFFTKIRGASKWAAIVLLLVILQVMLGGFARALPAIGALHGFNALLLFGAAIVTARRAQRLSLPSAPSPAATGQPEPGYAA